MNTLFKIAWRNLWRNKRRTFLTASAVIIAVILVLFMRSMQFGSYDMMIKAAVNQVGDFQIHNKGYWENQSIDEAFFADKNLVDSLKKIPEITSIAPTINTYSLASYGKQTKGVLISGIDLKEENSKTNLSGKIIKGRYLNEIDNGIIIGDNLAKFYKIALGDSLAFIGQGYQGMTAYGLFPVVGIFHLPSTQMNNQYIYMELTNAQEFICPYQPGILTGYSVFLKNSSQLKRVEKKLSKITGKNYEVISWKTILASMLQFIKADNISGLVMAIFLYLVAAFGIFSTVLMMTMEKRKQYAVMVSIGMQRTKLIWVSVIETFIVSLVGIIIGLIIITPVLIYLNIHPIPITGDLQQAFMQFNIPPFLPFSLSANIFIKQVLIILGLSLLSVLYPIFYLAKFNVLNAFRR
ncbi:putative ABC-type transport system (Lipoprotein release), permease component [uncultured Paludibacter sp.]|nr:putative ABC-type transport system (Lipoprotein release), permease component [uncultured Paludibacter sp.]